MRLNKNTWNCRILESAYKVGARMLWFQASVNKPHDKTQKLDVEYFKLKAAQQKLIGDDDSLFRPNLNYKIK